LSLETKKEQVKIKKKKDVQPKTHSIKDELSTLQTAPKKKGTHPPHSKSDEKPREPFKEKYRGLLNPTPEYLPAEKTGGKKDPTVPKKVEQPEDSRIVLMDIDPHRLHAYWEIAHRDKKRILEQLDEPSYLQSQIMRVYDVTYLHFDGNNAHSYFDIEIDKDRGNWYINLWSPHKSFCAEIGIRSFQGDFYSIARSNFVDTPRPYQSFSGEEQWMKVSRNYEEISLLSANPHTEKIELTDTSIKRENLINFSQRKKELQEPDQKRAHTPLSKEKIQPKSMPSIEKELTLKETVVKKDTTPTLPQSHKEKTPSEKKVIKKSTQEINPYEEDKRLFTESNATKESTKPYIIKNEVIAYYRKFRFIAGEKEKKTKPPPTINPHHESVISLEEDPNHRLFTERHTHYGSDIRWEKEVKENE